MVPTVEHPSSASRADPKPFRITFRRAGEWAAEYDAEAWLAINGYSVGRGQRGARRGILYGDFDIQKWRNLRPADIAALDGWMSGDGRLGPVTVTLTDGRLRATTDASDPNGRTT